LRQIGRQLAARVPDPSWSNGSRGLPPFVRSNVAGWSQEKRRLTHFELLGLAEEIQPGRTIPNRQSPLLLPISLVLSAEALLPR
jgi:hypothetical protein